MLLYDKKSDSIDIYTVDGKIDELKRYRASIIDQFGDGIDFYSISTNYEQLIEDFLREREISLAEINYDLKRSLKWGIFSGIKKMSLEEAERDEIFKSFIEGAYVESSPTTVYQMFYQHIPFKDKTISSKEELCHLIKTKSECEVSIIGWGEKDRDCTLPHLMDLPYNLYLLQLLEQGCYEELVSKDIASQLSLFDINYLKNIRISDIRDIVETGLISGTVEEAIQKAETGSKILQKVKPKK